MSDYFEKEIEQLVDHINNIVTTENQDSVEFGYDNPVIICIDAVLAIRRKYYSFVVPRIEEFRKKNPDIKTLASLLELIETNGHKGFCDIWNYQHIERVILLENLIRRFKDYIEKNNFQDDITGMKHWAINTSPNDYRYFGVTGIGMATFQYLRMLLGVQTVKPDVHIKKAVSEAIGREVKDIEAIVFIERASEILDIPATQLDHKIWQYFADKPEE